MMLERWYRVAMALPYLVTLVCGVVAQQANAPTEFTKVLTLIAFVGMFAAIPYTLYLVALLMACRPRTGSEYRRAALLAPLVIAVPFSVVATAIDGGLAEPAGILLQSVAVYGVAALVVGYAYVAVVESVAIVIRMRR